MTDTIPGSLHVPRGPWSPRPTPPTRSMSPTFNRTDARFSTAPAGSRSWRRGRHTPKAGLPLRRHDGGIQAWTAARRPTQTVNRE